MALKLSKEGAGPIVAYLRSGPVNKETVINAASFALGHNWEGNTDDARALMSATPAEVAEFISRFGE
jgi:hypothetical protein